MTTGDRAAGAVRGSRSQADGRLRGAPGVLRLGLVVVAVSAASVGVWATFDSPGFFQAFPGVGGPWVAPLPPYNEHLTHDVGTLHLGFAVLFALAARWLELRLVRAALVGWLVAYVPHLLFHAGHLGVYSATQAVSQMTSLGALVVLPAVLLASTFRRVPSPRT